MDKAVKAARAQLNVRRGLLCFFCLVPLPIVFLKPLVGVPVLLVFIALAYRCWGSIEKERENLELSACVVTNQRALTVSAAGRKSARSFPPEKLKNMTVKTQPDGSGSIVFYETRTKVGESESVTQYGFINIPNVREAEEKLRDVEGSSR